MCTSTNHKIDKSADPPLTYYFIYESRELKERLDQKMKVQRKNKQKRRKKNPIVVYAIKKRYDEGKRKRKKMNNYVKYLVLFSNMPTTVVYILISNTNV